MGKWATSAASWLENQHTSTQIDSEKFVEERRLIRSSGPRRWEGVRNRLKDECSDLATETGSTILDFQVCPQTQARIRNSLTGSMTSVDLDIDAALIEWTCGTRKGHFVLKPTSSSTIGIFDSSDRIVETEQVVEALLDVAVGKKSAVSTQIQSFDAL